MAKIFYGNSSNVPKNISAMFIGNSSRPRLIKKIYIGDSSNKPKLCYEDASGLVSVTYNLSSSSITSSSSNPLYVDPNSISSTTPLLLTFDIQSYSAEIPIFIQIQGGDGKFTESITGDENTGLGSLTVNITSVNPTQPIDVKISLSKYIPAGCYVLSPQLTSNGHFTTDLSEEPLYGATILTRSNNSGSYNFYSVDSITVNSEEGLKYNVRNSDSEYHCCGYSTYASAHSGYNNLWGYWDDNEHWGYSDIELNTLMFEADTEVSDALYDFLFNNPAEVLFQPAIHWGVYQWNTTDIQGGLEGYNLWYQVKPDDPQMQSDYNAGMLMTKLASSFDGGPIHYINEEIGADFEAMSTSLTPDDILIPFTQVVTPDLKEFLSQNLTMYSNYTGNTEQSQLNDFEVLKMSSSVTYRLRLHFDPFSASGKWSIYPDNLPQYQPISYGAMSFESVLIEVENIHTNENQTESGYFAFESNETSYFNEEGVSYDNGSLKWRWGNIFIPSIYNHSYLQLYLV